LQYLGALAKEEADDHAESYGPYDPQIERPIVPALPDARLRVSEAAVSGARPVSLGSVVSR
jgi:hypothetical protein